LPALTNRHSVAEENGSTSGTSWDWRTKPVSGKTDGMDGCFDMSGNLMK
jgi:hypothetical protein